MIGETHYCAKLVDVLPEEEIIFQKELPSDARSEIIKNLVRLTAQLAELSLSFQKVNNRRHVFLDEEMIITVCVCKNVFYIQSNMTTIEMKSIGYIIKTILEDVRRPLFRSIPKLSYEEIFLKG